MPTPLTAPLHHYLQLMARSRLLVGQQDAANIRALFSLLSQPQRDMLCQHYGLFGQQQLSLADMANEQTTTPEALQQHIDQCLRRLAITPEWQTMLQDFSPTVRGKIGGGIR